MFWRYLKVQASILLYGLIGPFFLFLYFASDKDPFMNWFLWSGLAVTAVCVVTAVVITISREKSDAKTAVLEQTGVLASARVMDIHETGTSIGDQPLVKLDLHISGPGFAPFTTQDRVIASMSRLPMITGRRLVALVDPATSEYQIDWDRSAFVSGAVPATFTLEGDDETYDLSGQVEPLIEILEILKSHGIGMNNLMDLRSIPAAREQIRAVVRGAAAQKASTAAGAQPQTAERLQELEALRGNGGLSESEYMNKRQRIIAEL